MDNALGKARAAVAKARGDGGAPAVDAIAAGLWAAELALPVDIDPYGFATVDGAQLSTAFQDRCQPLSGDTPAFTACAQKLAGGTQVFGPFQMVVIDSSTAYFFAQNASFGCREMAEAALIGTEAARFLGATAVSEPSVASLQALLTQAHRADQIAAAMAALVGVLQAAGDLAVAPEALAPVVEAIPVALDAPVAPATEAEIAEVRASAVASVRADAGLQRAKAEIGARPRGKVPGGKPPKAGKVIGRLTRLVGAIASGNFREVAGAVAPLFPEDSPVRAGIECVGALMSRDIKGVFVSARKLLPKGKLKSALEIVPVK